jgi:hypothetical protein
MHHIGQINIGYPPVSLQLGENPDIDAVEFQTGYHRPVPSLRRRARLLKKMLSLCQVNRIQHEMPFAPSYPAEASGVAEIGSG